LTVLSDREILAALSKGMLRIAPFSKERLSPGGYDFGSDSVIDLSPKNHKLILTSESIELSAQILATIHLKSSLAREGVIGSFAIIDPGFKGRLTLLLYNAGTTTVHIEKNEPIVQIVFNRTGEPSDHPYTGKYQNSYKIIQSRRRR
jgi:dCTP deaminase